MSDTSEGLTGDDPAEDAGTEAMPSWMPGGLGTAEEDDFGQNDPAPEDNGPGADLAACDDAEPDAGSDAEPDAEAPPAGVAGEAIVVLPRQARLAQAEDLVQQLRAAVGADTMIIDAREVEDITTPVITALICALRSRADRTPPAAVLAPTPAFVDGFSDLGLFQDLMKMEFRQ